eukprot:TRINITY_DN10043_c0_g1_i1.p2 TRINITY_DN10043_c0_g1~~TRINITY_DN10043_c0_g1_i1.p2  ORF type:complete len:149 (+),score=42.41 TRINITY_DN10043_c0_g1_i1:351-797(+)
MFFVLEGILLLVRNSAFLTLEPEFLLHRKISTKGKLSLRNAGALNAAAAYVNSNKSSCSKGDSSSNNSNKSSCNEDDSNNSNNSYKTTTGHQWQNQASATAAALAVTAAFTAQQRGGRVSICSNNGSVNGINDAPMTRAAPQPGSNVS